MSSLCFTFICGENKGVKKMGSAVCVKPVTKQRLFHWIVDCFALAYSSSGLQVPAGLRAYFTRVLATSWPLFMGVSKIFVRLLADHYSRLWVCLLSWMTGLRAWLMLAWVLAALWICVAHVPLWEGACGQSSKWACLATRESPYPIVRHQNKCYEREL